MPPEEEAPPAPADETPPVEETPPPAEHELGGAGKKAIAAERKARADAEKRAREAEAERDELRKATLSDTEKAIEEARTSARAEALGEANARIIRSEVRAAAARKLNDPADATAMLDLTQFSVNEDGTVDEVAIADAIDQLIESKPYLAASDARPAPGDPDAGARRPVQPKDLQTHIREAEVSGDFGLAGRLKASQLLSS